MRLLQVSGVLLIALGLWVLIRPPSYPHEESVFKLGNVEAKMQEQRPVPPWLGGAALGAGVVLFVVGLKRR
jgi:hypothetical protein